MSRWQETTLGEACELYQPKTISSAELVADGKYPVYGANGIIGRFDKFNHADRQLLITCRGATCGSVNVSQPNSWINGNAMVVRPKDNSIEVKYLEHLFRGGVDLTAVITGAAQPQITRQSLAPLKVRFPVPTEQRRIAAILDQADALRVKRREALVQLDNLTQSIFIEMFGNPIPTRSRWPIAKLSVACTKISDGTHHSPPIQSAGIPYITAKHLKAYGLDFYLAPWFVSPEDHHKIYARCDPKPGDVLYIKDGATTGIAAVNQYDFEFSMLSSLALLRPDSGILNAYYLCYWLNNPVVKNEILGAMAGAAISRLTLTKIKAISLPLPSVELQRQFASRVASIQMLKNAQSESLVELDALFASLQHRAFRGEL